MNELFSLVHAPIMEKLFLFQLFTPPFSHYTMLIATNNTLAHIKVSITMFSHATLFTSARAPHQI